MANFQLAFIAPCPCLENFARETTVASKPEIRKQKESAVRVYEGKENLSFFP